MAIDTKLADAIRAAAVDLGQPAELAERVVAWMNSLASGNETLDDPDSVSRHLELLFESARIDGDEPKVPGH